MYDFSSPLPVAPPKPAPPKPASPSASLGSLPPLTGVRPQTPAGPPAPPPLTPRSADAKVRATWEEAVVKYGKEVLCAVEAAPGFLSRFDEYVQLCNSAPEAAGPFMDLELFLSLEKRREARVGRNETLQVRNKLLYDALNDELKRVVCHPVASAKSAKPAAPSFLSVRRLKPAVRWEDVKAKLLRFVSSSTRGCTSQLVPMSGPQRTAKIDALIRADVRDEPGDWMDAGLEELHVYSMLTDSLLADSLDFVAAEVAQVLAKRAGQA